jgi:hypothetical protein
MNRTGDITPSESKFTDGRAERGLHQTHIDDHA